MCELVGGTGVSPERGRGGGEREQMDEGRNGRERGKSGEEGEEDSALWGNWTLKVDEEDVSPLLV